MSWWKGLCGALLLLLAGSAGIGAEEPIVFERGELLIETASGQSYRFDVEIAATSEQRGQGLMFRESMAEDSGMLFIYAAEQPIRMWMRNTLIPLDMLFIARDGHIVNIAERTEPLSEAVIASVEPALGVVELNAGTAHRLGIRPGDRVRHPAFAGG
jgi:uncharacterized membrane protein (UPF0127 family)